MKNNRNKQSEFFKKMDNSDNNENDEIYDVVFKNGQYFFKKIESKKNKTISEFNKNNNRNNNNLSFTKDQEDNNFLIINKKIGKSYKSKGWSLGKDAVSLVKKFNNVNLIKIDNLVSNDFNIDVNPRLFYKDYNIQKYLKDKVDKNKDEFVEIKLFLDENYINNELNNQTEEILNIIKPVGKSYKSKGWSLGSVGSQLYYFNKKIKFIEIDGIRTYNFKTDLNIRLFYQDKTIQEYLILLNKNNQSEVEIKLFLENNIDNGLNKIENELNKIEWSIEEIKNWEINLDAAYNAAISTENSHNIGIKQNRYIPLTFPKNPGKSEIYSNLFLFYVYKHTLKYIKNNSEKELVIVRKNINKYLNHLNNNNNNNNNNNLNKKNNTKKIENHKLNVSEEKTVQVINKTSKLINFNNYIDNKQIKSFEFKNNNFEVNSYKELLLKLLYILHKTEMNFHDIFELNDFEKPYFSFHLDYLENPKLIQGTDIYLETNFSSKNFFNLSIEVLELFDYNKEDIKIIFSKDNIENEELYKSINQESDIILEKIQNVEESTKKENIKIKTKSRTTKRNFNIATKELNICSSNLDLPKDLKKIAYSIYEDAVKNNLIKGRSIEVVIAASLYIACRKSKVPRTLDEIAESSNKTKKEVGRTYRLLAKELDIKLLPISPLEFIPRFANKLKLSKEIRLILTEILEKTIDKGLCSGKDPISLIAGATYIAFDKLGQKKTQEEIGELFGITTVTIRNRYKELEKQVDLKSIKIENFDLENSIETDSFHGLIEDENKKIESKEELSPIEKLEQNRIKTSLKLKKSVK